MRIFSIVAILASAALALFACDFIDQVMDEVSGWEQYGGSKDSDVNFSNTDPDFPGFDCSDACAYAIDHCKTPPIYSSYGDCILDCDRALDIDENVPSDFSYKTCIMNCIMDCEKYDVCIDQCKPELEE